MRTSRFLINKQTWFVALMSGGLVWAAAVFNPNWVNSSTNATQPIAYVGAPAASGYVLTSPQKIFTIDYSAADWSGDMHARTIDTAGTISGIDSWGNGAAYQVDNQNFDTDRKIVTWNGSTGAVFRWANLTTSDQTALGATNVLNFIRGDRSNEGTGAGFRVRGSVLGDIIHSTPLHWDDGTNQTVFVGANDGMLHAFNVANGSERYAYIPSQLISRLSALKSTPYLHQYFVDGQLAARKYPAYTESGGTPQVEMSILVGGLGGGGRGLFALDIGAIPTSESDAALKVLWEISNNTTGFANLGNTYGTPILTKLPNGDAALIVGNGYNNAANGGTARLFVINPHTGSKIAELNTGSGSASSPNGLSSPTVLDENLDGKADYAYAGDIDGNLWKFDLSNFSTAPVKLFPTSTATQTTPAQAITMAPGFKRHPLGGWMVNFVTGKLFNVDTSGGLASDTADTATHYAYGIWDRPSTYTANNTLLTQSLTEGVYTGVTPNIRVRTATNNLPDWSPGTGHHMGWKTALPVGGERVVGDGAFVTGSVFLFMTSNPAINTTATPPGGNWWMQLNALTGGDNGSVRFDLNADTHFTTADQVGSDSPVGRYMGGGVRSQLTAFTTAGFDIFQANYDQNGDPPSSSTTTERGVSGGHFDVDVYYGSSVTGATTATGKYQSIEHIHEYDDIYDVTGVNMLDASNAIFDLSNAIPSTATEFKVIASNQYLSPAVKIHLNGSPSYVYNVDQGYLPIKNFTTSSSLDLTNTTQVPTYTRATVNSLAINMPVDAFSPKDWWGGALGLSADVRVGLHPTQTGCVKKTSGAADGGNMYQPVTPPLSVTADGNGTIPSPRTTGVRHNGALTIQVIKATTPNSAIELSIPGHPEYGWRVNSANYSTQVLAEYTVFWHEKLIGKCYGETGWIKTAAVDTRACGSKDTTTTRKCATNQSAAGGTDPKIGSLGAVSAGTTTTTETNSDGTTTTTTVVIALNGDGTYTTTTTVTNSGGGSTTSTTTSNSITVGGQVSASGAIGGGVTTPLEALGRVNWRELRR